MTTLIRPKALSLTEWKQAAHEHQAPADAMIRKYYSATVKAEGEPVDRTMSFTVSTGSQDRDGDDIAVNGWKLDNYRSNPVVLWAHDYSQPPVGKSLETAAFNGALKSLDQFAPAEIYPFADTIYQLILGGYLNACSVGFLPIKWEEVDPNNWWGPVHFLEQEMLEHSIVPVPANPEALVDAKSKGIDTSPLLSWAERVLSSDDSLDRWMSTQAEKTWAQLATKHTTGGASATKVVPPDVSRDLADEAQAWSAPTLADFTDEAWTDLSDSEKKDIAGHYAWAKENPPAAFGDLKLPHHDAKTGKVVWNGVHGAMAALNGARGGADIPEAERQAVYAHLVSHYKQFDQEPPDLKAMQSGNTKDIRIDATQCAVVDCDDPPVVAVPVCREHLDQLMDLDGEDDAEVMGGYRVLNSVSRWAEGFTKSGRVLSAANEDRIREARDALNAVLSQLDSGDGEEDDDSKAARVQAKAEEEAEGIEFEIGDEADEDDEADEEGFEVDEATLFAAVGAAVAQSLTAVTGRLPD